MKPFLTILISSISFILTYTLEFNHVFKISQKESSSLIIANPCPVNLESSHNNSADMINSLLTSNSPVKEQELRDSGISHLDYNDLELLSSPKDDSVCLELNSFKNEWLVDTPKTEYTYYQNQNFYFMVRWYNGNTTRFQPVFVFNSQYELIGLWSI